MPGRIAIELPFRTANFFRDEGIPRSSERATDSKFPLSLLSSIFSLVSLQLSPSPRPSIQIRKSVLPVSSRTKDRHWNEAQEMPWEELIYQGVPLTRSSFIRRISIIYKQDIACYKWFQMRTGCLPLFPCVGVSSKRSCDYPSSARFKAVRYLPIFDFNDLALFFSHNRSSWRKS